MDQKLWNREQKTVALKMLPYAFPLLLLYLGDHFCSSYSTLFLQLHGFSTQSIGTIGGVACILTIFAEMLFSRISDARRSVKRATILCMSMTAICVLLVPLSVNWKVFGFSVVLATICVRNTIVTPMKTLTDNWVLRSSYHEKFDYATAKSVGVVGSIAGSFLTTAVMLLLCQRMEQVKATEIFYFIAFTMLCLTLLSLLRLRDAPAAAKEQVNQKSLNPMRMFKSREYLLLLLMYGFCCMAMNPSNVFLSVAMTENGLDAAKLGLILGLESVCQFPVLLTFARLKERIPLRILAGAGTALMGVAAFFWGNTSSMLVLALAAMLYGLAFGMQVTAAYNDIYQLVPMELRGSGQSYYVIFGSLGAAVGVTTAGYAIAAWGIHRFYLRTSIVTVLVGLAYLIVTKLLQKAAGKRAGV